MVPAVHHVAIKDAMDGASDGSGSSKERRMVEAQFCCA